MVLFLLIPPTQSASFAWMPCDYGGLRGTESRIGSRVKKKKLDTPSAFPERCVKQSTSLGRILLDRGEVKTRPRSTSVCRRDSAHEWVAKTGASGNPVDAKKMIHWVPDKNQYTYLKKSTTSCRQRTNIINIICT